MIILGAAGINFSGPRYDRLKKRQLEELPITIFAIHGNHEQRPFTIESYKEQVWNGGMAYYEEQLEREAWDVDVVLSHTTPLKYEPVEVFMSGVDQSKVDKTTENWLDKI